MRLLISCCMVFIFSFFSFSQTPKTYNAAEILLQIKKLDVFGSVLYIAAHPDDENTRLLTYLANEKLYRTAYLSLTRGEGGQNLIGDEQGIDLGLIRTQELLAARRIDGAEQFFSSAEDFGYSKSPEEALQVWGHDKILGEVVWVIRKFRPDVIITRFPTTGEGGHGHHTASAMLAAEAFEAAADSTKFPGQLKYVSSWKTKRLLWNTFNFGSTNTTREDQFKIDCGGYNPLLGKSNGEIASLSRSQHRSQGFGVPSQRGTSYEYFMTIKGQKPINDLMDAVDTTINKQGLSTHVVLKESLWNKDHIPKNLPGKAYHELIKNIIDSYDAIHPERSIKKLEELRRLSADTVKSSDIDKIIFMCSGIFVEAIALKQLNVAGDSINIQFILNNRLGIPITRASAEALGNVYTFKESGTNENSIINATIKINEDFRVTQPDWLPRNLTGDTIKVLQVDSFTLQRGLLDARFSILLSGSKLMFNKPVQYKYTDPVMGEIFQPVQVINPLFVNSSPSLIIFPNNKKGQREELQFTFQPNIDINERVRFEIMLNNKRKLISDSLVSIKKGEKQNFTVLLNADSFPVNTSTSVTGIFTAKSLAHPQYLALNKISHDHIPDIFYHYTDNSKVLKMDLSTSGTLAGYIAGAGDKVPEALQQMGYRVIMLSEKDLTSESLKKFDVVITGVRAYNIHTWLNNSHKTLMEYVKDGGVLLIQYNTNSSVGPLKSRLGPYPFTISRNRITDEKAKVDFLLPDHPALNYPNKITGEDFKGWVQERSIYHAENIDSNYQRILSMRDPGEKEHDGSLIITNYGRGKFVYTGLVFFRELPAAVPGAYRLFANLIANKKSIYIK